MSSTAAGTADVRETFTDVTLENLEDICDAERGILPTDQVRRVTLTAPRLDRTRTFPAISTRLLIRLGLQKRRIVHRDLDDGEGFIYESARLTIGDRSCTTALREVPDDSPAILGEMTLVALDLVVDPVTRAITGNPAHGGEQVLELF